MKYLTLLLFMALACVSADGQRREKIKKDKFNSAKFKDYELEIRKKRFDSMEFVYPVTFSFIDARADKSKLGFIRAGNGNEFFNMKFPIEADEYINSRTHGASKSSGSDPKKLLIVIRHFWLSQLIVNSSLLKNILLLDAKGYISYCYFSGEFYLGHAGRTQWLGRMDSVIHFHRWMGNVAPDLINDMLESAMDLGDSLAAHVAPTTASFANQQLMDSLENQFSYPILKTGAPRRGIYLTYENFLNDAPLDEEFELEEGGREDYLRGKKTDTSITNKAWGYCDGKNIFKHFNEDYFMMVRVQNTFEVAGPRIIRQAYTIGREFFILGVNTFLHGILSGPVSIFKMLSDKSIMKELIPYQLNIRDGTFY